MGMGAETVRLLFLLIAAATADRSTEKCEDVFDRLCSENLREQAIWYKACLAKASCHNAGIDSEAIGEEKCFEQNCAHLVSWTDGATKCESFATRREKKMARVICEDIERRKGIKLNCDLDCSQGEDVKAAEKNGTIQACAKAINTCFQRGKNKPPPPSSTSTSTRASTTIATTSTASTTLDSVASERTAFTRTSFEGSQRTRPGNATTPAANATGAGGAASAYRAGGLWLVSGPFLASASLLLLLPSLLLH